MLRSYCLECFFSLTVLTSIQLLMSEANPDDGLMADISKEYKLDRPRFLQNAKAWVEKYASEGNVTDHRKRKLSAEGVDVASTSKQSRENPSEQ